MMNHFGQYLKGLRGEHSLREVQVATGISHTYLSTLEKGYDPRTKKERKPSFDVLQKLADFYNVPYVDLLQQAGYLSEQEKQQIAKDEYKHIFKTLEESE